MKTPPFLLGFTLLFWGWQTGLWPLAIPMAACLEAARFLNTRWDFSQADYNRVWNLCTALFLGASVYLVTAHDGGGAMAGFFPASTGARAEALNRTSRAAMLLFQWFPLLFFPFVAVQAYSTQETVPVSTFSWWLRRQQALHPERVSALGINTSPYYLAISLLAASATNQRAPWFYAGFSALLAWTFWTRRSPRFSPAIWGAVISAVIGLGFVGHRGLNHLQKTLENLDLPWFSRFAGAEFDPRESRTAIGSIGKLKLSGRIILRVVADSSPPPGLLREASDHVCTSPGWFAARKDFIAVSAETDDATWNLGPPTAARPVATISQYLRHGRGLLALPLGTVKLESLPVQLVEHNRLGAVRVSGGPGLVSYQATLGTRPANDSAPEEDDLGIPETESAVLTQIASGLKLATQSPTEAIKTVSRFFQDEFQYSLDLRAPEVGRPTTALADFLLNRKAGHCEYFATATALLLRTAKIPTRYTAGYAVQEQLGKQYVVRERHAHAWCLVHVNGAWQNLDTTPASWSATEAAQASAWERFSDVGSRLWFEFSKWRSSQTDLRKYLLWLAGPLVLGFAAQFIFRRQWARSRKLKRPFSPSPTLPGIDSEFYEIERRLHARGLERAPGETLATWICRVLPQDALLPLVELHYRLRFDPPGLTAPERLSLQQGVRKWLDQNPAETR